MAGTTCISHISECYYQEKWQLSEWNRPNVPVPHGHQAANPHESPGFLLPHETGFEAARHNRNGRLDQISNLAVYWANS